MKKLTNALIAAGLMSAAVSAGAQGSGNQYSGTQDSGISGNVALTTDYIFRGVSRSGGQPALQGSLDYTDESGFYAGVWGSNVAIADSLELDYYAGYRGQLTEGVAYDVGATYFTYPGYSSADTLELHAGVDYAGFTARASQTANYFGTGSRALNFTLGYGTELVQNLNLDMHLGYSDARERIFGNRDSYADYGIALSAGAAGLDVKLAWTNSTLSRSNCGGTDYCDSNLALTVSRSL